MIPPGLQASRRVNTCTVRGQGSDLSSRSAAVLRDQPQQRSHGCGWRFAHSRAPV